MGWQHNGTMALDPDSLKSIVPPAPQLVQIYFIFAACCQRCNPLLTGKCFIAAYFCLCFLLMCSTPGKQSVRREQDLERDVLRWVLLYLLFTYTCLFPYGLQCRHMQLKIARPLGTKALAVLFFFLNLFSLVFNNIHGSWILLDWKKHWALHLPYLVFNLPLCHYPWENNLFILKTK